MKCFIFIINLIVFFFSAISGESPLPHSLMGSERPHYSLHGSHSGGFPTEASHTACDDFSCEFEVEGAQEDEIELSSGVRMIFFYTALMRPGNLLDLPVLISGELLRPPIS